MSESVGVQVRGSPSRCPYCHSDCAAEGSVVCGECLARHHQGCWNENGACGSCSSRRRLVDASDRPPPPWTAVPVNVLRPRPAPSSDVLLAKVQPELRERVERELLQGERLLWAGWSRRSAHAREKLVRLAVGLILAVVGLATYTGALHGLRPDQDGLLIGAGLIVLALVAFASFLFAFIEGGGVWYAVTDHRVLVWQKTGVGEGTLRAFQPTRLRDVTRRERTDGSGNVTFSCDLPDGRIDGANLLGVENVWAVEKLLLATFPPK